jgi:hypothetical protein
LDGIQINTRYTGILDPIRRVALALEYALALSGTFQSKTVISKLLGAVVLRLTLDFLVRTANVKPKYSQIVVIENTQYLSEVLSKCLEGDAEALETSLLDMKKL